MADISKITLPNGSSYDFKDSVARSGLAGKADSSHTHNSFIKVNDYAGYDCNTLYDAGLYLCNGSATNTPNDLKYGSLFVMPYRRPYGNSIPDYCAQIYIPNGDTSDTSMWYRTSLQTTWNEWKRSCDGDNIVKPYVTGTVSGWTVPSSSVYGIAFDFLNFTPSFVVYLFNNGGSGCATPCANGFKLTIDTASGTSANYIAFK